MSARPSRARYSRTRGPGAAAARLSLRRPDGRRSPPDITPPPPVRGVRLIFSTRRPSPGVGFFLRSRGRPQADITRPPKKPRLARRTPRGLCHVALVAPWAAAGSCPQRQTSWLAPAGTRRASLGSYRLDCPGSCGLHPRRGRAVGTHHRSGRSVRAVVWPARPPQRCHSSPHHTHRRGVRRLEATHRPA